MALLNLLQFLQSDDQATIIDKMNFNFDQILSMGGGPPGSTGNQGDQGIPGQQGIQGFQGEPGTDGAYWFVNPSTVTPSIPTPKDGDLWYQTDNNNVLQYTGSPLAWAVVGNLSAPAQSGVVRSNGNIYVYGDEDGGGPGIDGDTILAYDAVANEARGNVRIHGDIITGITAPPGWVSVTLGNSDVKSSNGSVTFSANLGTGTSVLSYKIIGKTVHMSVLLHGFSNGSGASGQVISVKLPSALQNVVGLFDDANDYLKCTFSAGVGTGGYRNDATMDFFQVRYAVVNSAESQLVGGFANSWVLAFLPINTYGGGADKFNDSGGREYLQAAVTFEIS